MDRKELPLGFSSALGQNPKAMQHFTSLTNAERTTLLQKARKVSDKAEMQQLVQSLSERV